MSIDWKTRDPMASVRINEHLALVQDLPKRDAIVSHLRIKRLEVGDPRLEKLALMLARFAVDLGPKAFRDATTDDVSAHLANRSVTVPRGGTTKGGRVTNRRQIELGDRSNASRFYVIREFLRRTLKTDRPAACEGIKVKFDKEPDVTYEDLYTREEARAMLDACQNAQERSIIAGLFDSGFRAGEMCAMNDDGFRPHADGSAHLALPKDGNGLKSGPRTILVVDCVGYVKAGRAELGRTRPTNEPLWPDPKTGGRHTNWSLAAVVKKIARRAGIKRRVWLHLFRHTCATAKAKLGWNESKMRKYFGWSWNSVHPAYYSHLADQDVDDRIRADAGIIKTRATQASAIEALLCPKCGAGIPTESRFCNKCGSPVGKEARKEAEREALLQQREAVAFARAILQANDLLDQAHRASQAEG